MLPPVGHEHDAGEDRNNRNPKAGEKHVSWHP